MKWIILIIANIIFLSDTINLCAQYQPSIIIHGGAGDFDSKSFVKEDYDAYYNTLYSVLSMGDSLLKSGASAMDVAVACVAMMEDSPLFNAGKGAVYNAQGKHELDASVMDGSNLKAGSVAGITRVKNPVKAARMVMDNSQHVMLAGKGADEFAKKQGLQMVKNTYFDTPAMYQRYQKLVSGKKGTVGAVVLDSNGNLAAATSTGGMMMKQFGRIGDSPVIGAGTYADNATCAVSCTGHGEYFIRFQAAYDIAAQMKYAGLTLFESCRNTIDKIGIAGGTGGVIAIDCNGNQVCRYNTKSMFRGSLWQGEITVEF